MCGVALERGNYTKPEKKQLQLFENQKIRTAWDEEKEEWYFSIYGCGCGFDGTARPAQCQQLLGQAEAAAAVYPCPQ